MNKFIITGPCKDRKSYFGTHGATYIPDYNWTYDDSEKGFHLLSDEECIKEIIEHDYAYKSSKVAEKQIPKLVSILKNTYSGVGDVSEFKVEEISEGSEYDDAMSIEDI